MVVPFKNTLWKFLENCSFPCSQSIIFIHVILMIVNIGLSLIPIFLQVSCCIHERVDVSILDFFSDVWCTTWFGFLFFIVRCQHKIPTICAYVLYWPLWAVLWKSDLKIIYILQGPEQTYRLDGYYWQTLNSVVFPTYVEQNLVVVGFFFSSRADYCYF